MEAIILLFSFITWIGLIIVNVSVAEEKGVNSWGTLFLSIFAAPVVYLYILATPTRSTPH